MLSALKKLLPERPPQSAGACYIALVAAARNPFFFNRLCVPDTIDGRFELIVLHLFLLQHRLHETPSAHEFARFVSEAFFDDMDRSIREFGVMDTGVVKRIKRMGKAYNGRLQAYSEGLGDPEKLKSALARNLYGTVPQGDVTLLERTARYIQAVRADLGTAELSTILAGNYAWPDPAALGL